MKLILLLYLWCFCRILIGQYVSSHGDVISHVNMSSVRVGDGGLYQCTASNSAGSTSHSARLNVYGPPMVRAMGHLTAVAGETFTVTCPVAGHPIEKVTWAKGQWWLIGNDWRVSVGHCIVIFTDKLCLLIHIEAVNIFLFIESKIVNYCCKLDCHSLHNQYFSIQYTHSPNFYTQISFVSDAITFCARTIMDSQFLRQYIMLIVKTWNAFIYFV